MGWYAKPSGGYSTTDNEAQQNMFMVSQILQDYGWSMVAIAGLLGNVGAESGFNPWRWQKDRVNYDKGYGLVQFTPADYYIGGRGTEVGIVGYAPNLSVSEQTTGASETDGEAQLQVIEVYHDDKFLDRRNKCNYADLTDTYPYSSYKNLTDLWIATVGWLYNYEYPGAEYRDYAHAYARYLTAQECYQIITGSPPPTPPHPPTPPSTDSGKFPLYFYMARKNKAKKGLL